MGDKEHDEVLASNLEDLYALGVSRIPDLASEFGAAAKTLDGMSGLEKIGARNVYEPYDTSNGATPEGYYADGGGLSAEQSPAMQAWIDARDIFSEILSKTESNLRDVGGALVLGVREIAEQDDAVAAILSERGLIRDFDDLMNSEVSGRIEKPEEFISGEGRL